MAEAIIIKNLSKTYNSDKKQITALNDINLTIPKGSFFGLLGPNGAGKSTLINIISNLVIKSQGKIEVLGLDYDENVNLIKSKIGVVPQELILDPFFSVREMIEIYAGYYGLKKSERKTDEIINNLGLSDKADVSPRSLSGGMRRRLMIAKALVHDPEIIILDEPTAGVDVELREQLWTYVKKLNDAGKTIILTTHYLEEAEKLCDYIAIIDKGKVISSDKKENLKKIFRQKKLILNFKKINKSLTNFLDKNFPYQIKDQEITVSFDDSKYNYGDFFAEIKKLNNNLLDIRTEETEVEDIFRNLILKNN